MMTIVTMIRRIRMISKATIVAVLSVDRLDPIVVATIFVVSVSPEVDVLANV